MKAKLTPIAALLALALLAPAAALGAANHPFLGVVGQASYEDACGVAIGPGGPYVSDYYADAIEGPATIAAEAPQGGPCKLAFDPAGNLYVLNWHRDVVRYEAGHLASGAYEVIDPEPASAAEAPTGLAVDPASGDLYVAHRTYLARYQAPVHAGEAPAILAADPTAAYYGVAVSAYPATAGFLYLPDAARERLDVFDPATDSEHPREVIGGEATPQGHFISLVDSEVVVDNNPTSPSYGHLFLLDAIGHGLSAHPEGAFDEWGAEGDYRGQVKGFGDAEPSGLAIEAPSGNLLITSGNSEGSALFKYGPTAPARTLSLARSGGGGGKVTSSPNGIACGPACAAEFSEGERVTLFASPDAHSRFAGWSVSGAEPCPGTGTCTVLLNSNVEVQAEFEEPTQEALQLSVAGEGTVTSEPAGIECPSACAEHFAQGRQITLHATPAPGSRFLEWLGPGCDEGAQPSCQLTINQAEALEARFEAIPRLPLSLSLTGPGQGTVTSFPGAISCPGACSASFEQGSTVYLMAAPAPGSGFGGFAGGGCGGTATLCAVAMNAAQNVTATFTGTARGPGVAASAASAAALRLGSAQALPGAVVLQLRSAEAGTVFASSAATRPLRRQLRPGTSTVRLKLRRRARRRLARHGRLRLHLTLGFIASGAQRGGTEQLRLHLHRQPAESPRRR